MNNRLLSVFDRWVLDEDGYAVGILMDNSGTICLFDKPQTIDNVNALGFNLTAGVETGEGELAWNAVDETLNLGLPNNVTLQIGQEMYARVANNTGTLIPNGAVVGFAGATDTALQIAPYLANGASPSLYILGIMTHDLPDSGDTGYCTVWGFVRGLNTAAFNQGDILYASPSSAGGLTNVKPTAPNNVIPVAACVKSHATEGIIFVRPTIQQMQYYGVFSKITDQTPAVINTAYALTFDSTEIGNGIVRGTPTSRIVVPVSGLYQFVVTVQISSASSSAKNVWLWFRKNGVDVPNSARIVTISENNGYAPISLTQVISLTANQYVEIMFAASGINVRIDNVAATAFAPDAPATVLEVTQVQQ